MSLPLIPFAAGVVLGAGIAHTLWASGILPDDHSIVQTCSVYGCGEQAQGTADVNREDTGEAIIRLPMCNQHGNFIDSIAETGEIPR